MSSLHWRTWPASLVSILLLLLGSADGSTWDQTTDSDFKAGVGINLVVTGTGMDGALTLGEETFSYRREIAIHNTGGESLVFYQIKVVLSSSNFDFSKARPDGGDIRFTDSDGLTFLNYWVESWDFASQKAVVWVNVPSIGPGATKTIHLHYGNPDAQDAGSGTATFDLFDDFEDLAAWNQSGSTVSVADGIVTLDSGSTPSIWRDITIASPFIVELKYQHPSKYRNRLYLAKPGMGSPTGYDYGIFSPSIYWNGFTGVNLSSNTWYIIRWENTQSDYVWRILGLDGIEVLSRSHGSAISDLSRLIFAGTESPDSDFKMDWVRVRKYSAAEPSVTVGPEVAAHFRHGSFVSSPHDTSGYSNFETLSWDADVPVQTALRFQIRTGETESDLLAARWNGPQGPLDYYTTSGSSISGFQSPKRWVQYRVVFTSAVSDLTPVLRSLSIQHSLADFNISSDTVWPEGDYRVGHLTVLGGATFTLAGGSSLEATGTIRITGNSTLFLGGKNRSSQVGGQWAGVGVTISAAELVVESGSKITADGQGYTTGNGPGGSPDYNVGGSHGGRGSGGSSAPPYGSAMLPVDLGSAGGGAYGGWSAGGGAIRLNVLGLLLLNGQISANGTNSPGGNSAGGAGGSIYVTAGVISGVGRFSADGGAGSHGGEGGGGRIAVYYGEGSGFNGFTTTTASAGGSRAENGTVGFFDTSVTPNNLSIYQRFVFPEDSSPVFGNITLDNGAVVSVGGGSSIYAAGTFTVTGGSTLVLKGKNTGGKLNEPWAGVGVTISAAELVVESGSKITADGQGYTTGNGPGGSPDYNVGGSHGGRGSWNSAPPYGSAMLPVDLGSAGGGAYGGWSAGGGAIRLNVLGLLLLNGQISANGTNSPGGNSAGGAGGSIFLNVGALEGTGKLSADGGAGSHGGQGGGGRIAVYYWDRMELSGDQITVAPGGDRATAGTIYTTSQPVFRWVSPSDSVLHDTETLGWEALAVNPAGLTAEILASSGGQTHILRRGLPVMGELDWDTRTFPDGLYELRVIFKYASSHFVGEAIRNVMVNNSVVWHRGRINTDETWAANQVHVVEADVIVSSGTRLIIAPGATVKFVDGTRIIIESSGILEALGTEDLPIVFTSLADDTAGGDTNLDESRSRPIPGSWYGLVVQGTGQLNLNQYVSSRYIKTTHSGTLANDETWPSTYVHHVTGDVTVPNGVTLTIEPGAIIKFDRYKGILVSSGGSLIAEGEVAQPIHFTSVRDDSLGGDTNLDGNSTSPAAGDWRWLYVDGGRLVLRHAHLSYGGGSSSGNWDNTGMIRTAGQASVTISNSILREAFFDGVLAWGGSVAVTNSILTGTDRAICAHPNSWVQVTNCTLDDNRIGLLIHGGILDVTNTIVTNSLESGIQYDFGTLSSVRYSNVWAPAGSASVNYRNTADRTGMDGNISVNPIYKNRGQGNYRLNYRSLCIDAADGTVAPETDLMGAPRYDDPRTPNTGLPTGLGSFPDMGAFEFVETAESAIDLVVDWVTGPSTVKAGDVVLVQWQVANLGTGQAQGPWHDTISIVPMGSPEVFHAAEVLVGQGILLGPGETYVASAQIRVPGGTDGIYNWQIHTNSRGEIFEGRGAGNNVGVSATQTRLEVPEFTVGDEVKGRFMGAGQPVYLKFRPEGGKSVRLTLVSTAKAEIYVGRGEVPTQRNFWARSSEWNSTSSTVVIDSTLWEWYYVMLLPRSQPSTEVVFTLTSAYVSSEFGVDPRQIWYGIVMTRLTIPIKGSGFKPGLRAMIRGSFGGTNVEIQAERVYYENSSLVFATFWLRTPPFPSLYDLVLTQDGESRTLRGAFEVDMCQLPTPVAGAKADEVSGEAMGGPHPKYYGDCFRRHFHVSVRIPERFRTGREFVARIEYSNHGPGDLYAPLVIVTSPTGNKMRLSRDEDYQDSVMFQAISMSGPPGILRGGRFGSSYAQEVYVLGKEGENYLQVWYVWENTLYVMNWDDIKAAIRPTSPDPAWDSVWETKVKGSYDDSVGGYVRVLSDAATLRAIREGKRGGDPLENLSYYIWDSILELDTNLSGTVYNQDVFHPLGGVMVSVRDETKGLYAVAESTADGLVRFRNLAPGTYTLSFAGYLPLTPPQPVTISEGSPVRGLSWILGGGGRIVGRVIAPEGFDFQQEGGFSIFATDLQGHSCTGLLEPDGVYRFRGLPAGTYSVSFSGQELAPVSVEGLSVVEGQTTYAPNLVTRYVYGGIEGIVRSAETGLGLPNVSVSILDDLETYGWTVTDQQGRYRIEWVLPGNYQVVADDLTHVRQVASGVVVRTDEMTSGVDFNLVSSGSLSGSLSGEVSFEETIVYLKDGDMILAMAFADASGNYNLTDIPPGTYTIEVDCWECLISTSTVTIGAGTNEVLNISLSAASRLHGLVRHSGTGEPIWGAMTYLVFPDGARIYGDVSGPDGSFGFSRLEDGRYTLMLPDGSHRQAVEISGPAENLHVYVDLSVGQLTGKVMKSDGITPEEGAWVSLVAGEQELGTVLTDSEGRYLISLIAPGSYRLVIIGSEEYFPDQEVTVIAGRETVVPDILPSNSTLRVVFRDAGTGQPVTTGGVALLSRADVPDDLDMGRWVDIPTSGEILFENLVPGDYLLQSNSPGKSSQQVLLRVEMGDNALEVSLGLPGALSGQVTQPGGSPLASMSIVVYDPAQPRLRWKTSSDDSGQYFFSSLPAGSYKVLIADGRVDAQGPRYGPVQVSGVVVQEGSTNTLDIVMPFATAAISGRVGHTAQHIPLGAKVFAENQDGIKVAKATSDLLGGFVMESLAEGNYTVKGIAKGFLVASTTVSLANGEVRDNLVLDADWKVDPINWGSLGFSISGLFNRISNWLRNGLAKVLQEPQDTCGRLPTRPKDIEKCSTAWAWWRDVVYWQRAKDGFFDAWHTKWLAKQEIFWSNLGNAAANLAQLLAGAWQFTGKFPKAIEELEETAQIYKEFWASRTGTEALQWKQNYEFIKGQIVQLNLINGFTGGSSSIVQGTLGIQGLIDMFKNPSEGLSPMALAGELTGMMNNILNVVTGIGSIITMAKDIPGLQKAMDFLGPFGNLLGTISASIQMYQDSMAMYKELYDLESQVQLANSRRDTAYKWVLKAMENCDKEEENEPPTHWIPPPPQHTWTRGGGGSGTGLGSIDPNMKMTVGVGSEGFIAGHESILYTIYFENKASATAPAQKVVITDILPPSLDWSTVELVEVAFNKVLISIPPGLQHYETTVSVSTDPNPVRVQAGLEPDSGVMTWVIQSVDPVTGGVPEDPLAGFLPPNSHCGGCGEGFVSFLVYPKADLPSGATVRNEAMIIFDLNDPLTTDEVTNTIDSGKPSSRILPLPSTTSDESFTVKWVAADNPGGSGVSYLDIYVSIDGGDFNLWLAATSDTSATYDGERGHTYAFFSLATDNVGNQQELPSEPHASTTVSGMEVRSVLLEEDFSSGIPQSWLIAGAWSADDTCGSGIGDPFSSPWATVNSSCQQTGDEFLFSPVFDASLSNIVSLRMANLFEEVGGNTGIVLGSKDSGGNWAEICRFDQDRGPIWEGIDLSELAGAMDAQLGFRFTGARGSWAIDQIQVLGDPPKLLFQSPLTVESDPKRLLITNRDAVPLMVTGVEISGSTEFGLDQNTCIGEGSVLNTDESCSLAVVYTPATEQTSRATLKINSTDAAIPVYEVNLTGSHIIAHVHPAEGTMGTQITLRGSGFGAKKGKVLIGGMPVKVTSWEDGAIRCYLKRVPLPPAVQDVLIQRAKGAEVITIPDGFEVKGPEIVWLDRIAGKAGDRVKMVGKFFGSKKAKVIIGGRTAKVVSWVMNPVTGHSEAGFVVPKGLSPGAHDLTLTNKVSTTTRPGGFTILAP